MSALWLRLPDALPALPPGRGEGDPLPALRGGGPILVSRHVWRLIPLHVMLAALRAPRPETAW